MSPRLLDLFCGAGGAAVGYHRAGFDVVGVDIKSQPRYPFDFERADALETMQRLIGGQPLVTVQNRVYGVHDFDVVHASPPCQAHTRAGKLREAQGGKVSTGDLLTPTREWLQSLGLPYVIENVPGAPMPGAVQYCGSSFGLGVRRHRLFESNLPLWSVSCQHGQQGRPIGVYHVLADDIPQGGRTARTLAEAQQAMGIDWMEWAELKESIPPAFTEFIGQQLLEHLRAGVI